MKKDNRGITLVELVIAMAISVVIMGAATYFMRSAQKSYESAHETIDLQMESQVLMEQLSKWIMEGNGAKADGNMLVIYYIPRKTDTALPDGVTYDTTAKKRIIWQKDNKLYTKEVDGITDVTADITTVYDSDATELNCVGNYIKEFTPLVITGTSEENTAKVKISFSMTEGKMSYTLENEITLRNEWLMAKLWKGRELL